MSKVKVNDIEMFYEVYGSGAPLVYIGGARSDLQLASISNTPLVDHFRVLSFDQRGQGQTDSPDIPYSMAMYADDAAALMDATGFSPAMVMGVSFGGMVAQELALRHPEKVLFLSLCSSSSGGLAAAPPISSPSLRTPTGARTRISGLIWPCKTGGAPLFHPYHQTGLLENKVFKRTNPMLRVKKWPPIRRRCKGW